MKFPIDIDQADLEDVAGAYYARVQTLEAAARALVDDLVMGNTVRCPVCQAHLRSRVHDQGCTVAVLATLLEDE